MNITQMEKMPDYPTDVFEIIEELMDMMRPIDLIVLHEKVKKRLLERKAETVRFPSRRGVS
jgi:hypothetical protein